ncbi:hypothetical protein [Rhizobium binae]|uniref:hypothetical protein n=1 Tax=Rhizobium binae TaxID=1138190 RepID=UPI001C83FBD2|nr:hypothetical protein [Rhizobium binae]MBX4967873.1 hypothetical protein [Rhizobium binae]
MKPPTQSSTIVRMDAHSHDPSDHDDACVDVITSARAKSTWWMHIPPLLWRVIKFIWAWSPVGRYANKPIDHQFLGVWNISLEPDDIRRLLSSAFPRMPFEKLPTDEEEIRCLARNMSLPSTEAKIGLDKQDDSDSGLDGVYETVKTAFFEIMTREMFSALADQRPSGGANNISRGTPTAGGTLSHSYVDDMLSDAFPHLLDGELPAYKKAFCDLVRAIILRDLDDTEPDMDGCHIPGEAGIMCIVAETFPEASEEDHYTYEAVFRGWLQALVSPEETWRSIPKEIRHLLAALNAHHLLGTLMRCPSNNALFDRSRDGVDKIFRILKMGCRKGVSPKERLCSQTFLGVLIVYNILPLFAAGIRDERSFIERAFTGVVNVYVGMYFVCQFGFFDLWYLFNWSLERILGGIPFATIYIITSFSADLRSLSHEEWFTAMNASISAMWQIFVQFAFPIRDILSRFWTRWKIRQERKKGTLSEFDQCIRWELTTVEEFMTSADDPEQPVTATNVPLRVRVERFIKFSNLFDTGRALEFMLQLLRNYLEGCVNVLMDYNRCAPKALLCKKGHREPALEKFILAITTAVIFGFLCWAFWPQQILNFISSAYSGAVCFAKQTVIAFKEFQSPERARLQFTFMVASSLWAIFLVAIPYKKDEHILVPISNMLALMTVMCVVGFFFLEPIARLIQFCTSAGRKFARSRKRRKTSAKAVSCIRLRRLDLHTRLPRSYLC